MNIFNQKKTHLALLTSSLFLGIFISCEKDNTNSDSTTTTVDASSSVSLEKRIKLKNLGFQADDVELIDFSLPDGTTEKRYLVEGDIALPESYLNSFDVEEELTGEQYRSTNLVRGIRTINVIGITEGGFALPRNTLEGLRRAVDNYNNLNLNINFTLSFGLDGFRNFDMVVFFDPDEVDRNGNPAVGGVAGFPSSAGRPNQFIEIYGIANRDANINEHVITHEIGHSIGLRHTNWFSRSGCPGGRPEPVNPSGAVLIPGTPRGEDPGSLMNACFGQEDGEFGRNDIIALNALY